MPLRRTQASAKPSAQPLPPAAPTLPRPAGSMKGLAYVLALLQPAAGLTLAFVYWKSEDAALRRFARWCLALGLVGLVFGGGGDCSFRREFAGGERWIQPY